MQTKAHAIVLAELQKHRNIPLGDNTKIICPNPAHNDSNPSCYVYVGEDGRAPVGYHHCFSCGYSAEWNVAAEINGYEKLEESDSKSIGVRAVAKTRRDRLLPVEKSLVEYAKDLGCGMSFDLPSDYVWRGITASTLNSCGVRLTYDVSRKRSALLLPISIGGKIRGVVKAYEVKRGYEKNSYITSRGEWVKDCGLFPYDSIVDTAKRCGYVVLVEGSRDALRLIQEGIPALAILGVENWGTKRRWVAQLGVDVVLCMDGDVAGIEATNALRKSITCRAYKLRSETLRYQELARRAGHKDPESITIDPANMPKKAMKRFKTWLKAHH